VDVSQDEGAGAGLPDDSPGETVAVRFVNLTANEAVDVGFYATNDPVLILPDELLLEVNRVKTSIGVAGTGIIEPQSEDTIELACTADFSLGSTGGAFLDNDTGALLGVGQARWAQNEPLGLCGGTVTFVFHQDDEGYQTAILVGR
jgi:hypothetical protein